MSHIIKLPAPVVRREYDYRGFWPYSDRVIPASQPTITDRIIGQELINALTIMGIPWDLVLQEDFKMPRYWIALLPGAPDEDDQPDGKTLEDLYIEAKLEESRYLEEYGEIDNEYIGEDQPFTRPAHIGDSVQWLRTSHDDLDSLYGELTEDRPSRTFHYREGIFLQNGKPRKGHMIEPYKDVPYTAERYDGDGRFNAQNTELCGESSDLWFIDLHDPEERKRFFDK